MTPWTVAGKKRDDEKTTTGTMIKSGRAPKKKALNLAHRSCFWSKLDYQMDHSSIARGKGYPKKPCMEELSCGRGKNGSGPRKKKRKWWWMLPLFPMLAEGEAVLSASRLG